MKKLNLLFCISLLLLLNCLQAQNLENFDLQAHYTFVNTTEDALGVWDTVELINAPLSDTNGVYSFGGYINDAINEDSSLILTPKINVINAPQFAVQLEVKMDELESKGRPIVVVGESWRYLGFATGSDSSFQLILNGSYQSGEPYFAKAGVWQTLTMIHSTGDSLTSFYVDGTLIYRRMGFLDHPESDTKIMNTHFGNGSAFKGYWRNLKVFTSDSTTSPTRDISIVKTMSIFPNPSQGSVTIELDNVTAQGSHLLIYDNNGRLVQKVEHVSGTFELHNLPKGILTMSLIKNDVQIGMRRIVVE